MTSRNKGFSQFTYGISRWAPIRDSEVTERVRSIKKEKLTEHPNPDFSIEIVPDADIAFRRIHQIFSLIKEAADHDKSLALILPQPHPQYRKVADLCNMYKVSCRKLHTFNMDEWADDDGTAAPETWPNSFMHAMKNNFYYRLDEDLRPPEEQIQGPTHKNIKDYGKMMEDAGGIDVCFGGIGWSGHLSFIEPGCPEFAASSLEEWKGMGSRAVTLSPFTIAQSCLDPDFGMSGDWSWIPPRAVTVGPKEILAARLRCSWNPFTLPGSDISWQRFSVRMAAHGPITPDCPASMLQIGPTNMYISNSIAENIVARHDISTYA